MDININNNITTVIFRFSLSVVFVLSVGYFMTRTFNLLLTKYIVILNIH